MKRRAEEAEESLLKARDQLKVLKRDNKELAEKLRTIEADHNI